MSGTRRRGSWPRAARTCSNGPGPGNARLVGRSIESHEPSDDAGRHLHLAPRARGVKCALPPTRGSGGGAQRCLPPRSRPPATSGAASPDRRLAAGRRPAPSYATFPVDAQIGDLRDRRARPRPVQRDRVGLELSRVVLVHHPVRGLLSTRNIMIPVSFVQDQGATPGERRKYLCGRSRPLAEPLAERGRCSVASMYRESHP
jgi:hypothetical protein